MQNNLSPHAKAILLKLLAEKAVREHFIEKMRVKLSAMWKAGREKSYLYLETQKRYERFLTKVDEIDERIFNIVPAGTDGREMEKQKQKLNLHTMKTYFIFGICQTTGNKIRLTGLPACSPIADKLVQILTSIKNFGISNIKKEIYFNP